MLTLALKQFGIGSAIFTLIMTAATISKAHFAAEAAASAQAYVRYEQSQNAAN